MKQITQTREAGANAGMSENLLARTGDAPSRHIPPVVWLTVKIMLASLLVSWTYALVSHFIGLPKPYSWPYYVSHVTPTAPRGDRFGDFVGFYYLVRFHVHSYGFFNKVSIFNYPPAGALFFLLLSWPIKHFVLPFLALIFVLSVLAGRWMVHRLEALGVSAKEAVWFVVCSALLSYPLHFEFLRENLEFVGITFTAVGIIQCFRGRFGVAAVLFGMAASLKLFPFILFGIFLPHKRYKEFGLAWVVFALMTLTGLLVETPSLHASIQGTVAGFSAFSGHDLTKISEFIGYDHGILAFVKVLTLRLNVNLQAIFSAYLPVASLTAGVLYFVRMWRLPMLNQMLALVLCMVLLPPFSGDYTLLHLCAPIALLMLGLTAGKYPSLSKGTAYAMMTCVGLLFALESYVIVGGVLYAAQLKCAVALVFLGLVLWYPLQERVEADA